MTLKDTKTFYLTFIAMRQTFLLDIEKTAAQIEIIPIIS